MYVTLMAFKNIIKLNFNLDILFNRDKNKNEFFLFRKFCEIM
jgi:hypothetical protein